MWTPLNEDGGLVFEFMHTLPNEALFDENLTYFYRLHAKNGIGWSPSYSEGGGGGVSVTPAKRP